MTIYNVGKSKKFVFLQDVIMLLPHVAINIT